MQPVKAPSMVRIPNDVSTTTYMAAAQIRPMTR